MEIFIYTPIFLSIAFAWFIADHINDNAFFNSNFKKFGWRFGFLAVINLLWMQYGILSLFNYLLGFEYQIGLFYWILSFSLMLLLSNILIKSLKSGEVNLINHNETFEKLDNKKDNINDMPSLLEIAGYPKNAIIHKLIGKKFTFNGNKCTMEYGHGSAQTVWVIKEGWFGEHVIQAKKLYKHELIKIYQQVVD